MTMVAMDKEEGFRYTRDQTMADKLMYIPNNDSQSYPLCRLKLVDETFEHSKFTKAPEVVNLSHKKSLLKNFGD